MFGCLGFLGIQDFAGGNRFGLISSLSCGVALLPRGPERAREGVPLNIPSSLSLPRSRSDEVFSGALTRATPDYAQSALLPVKDAS